MRSLLIGVSLLALAAPAAHAQGADAPTDAAVSGRTEPGRYLVFFELDRATLTPDARGVVSEAAQEFQRTGAARISLAGHADRSASEAYNQRLSEQRVEAVRRELVRLGVPDAAVATVAEGETDPLVQTADGGREARNRRVEIAIHQPPPFPLPAPPVVAAPAPVEPTPPARVAEERPERFTFTLGPVYGHNFKEQDDGDTVNDLV